jgi:excisionase family DNA binding protein
MGNTTQATNESGSAGRELWTLREVARRWGCHPFTVRRLCWSGKLRATRIGTTLRISEAELQRYLRENTAVSTPDAAEAGSGSSLRQ